MSQTKKKVELAQGKGVRLGDTDVSEFSKAARATPKADDLKKICPNLQVDEHGQISGTVEGRKNVLALAEMYKERHRILGQRELRRAEKSEWVNLRDRDGKLKEVRAGNAKKVADRLGMYEPWSIGGISYHEGPYGTLVDQNGNDTGHTHLPSAKPLPWMDLDGTGRFYKNCPGCRKESGWVPQG